MMFTRVAPLRLKFPLIGSRTFVARTISLLTPFKAFPTRVSLSPRLYTSAVSMKLIPLSKASFTMRVVSSWPRLPMFILPPNCIVPSATLLTISPVFPSFLYLISPTPSFRIPQAPRTFGPHRLGQYTHGPIFRIRSPQQLLACLLLPELAPHHSAKKHIVIVHLCFLLSSAMLQSPSSSAIPVPTAARPKKGPPHLHAVDYRKHHMLHLS